jgi:hypothetical protein
MVSSQSNNYHQANAGAAASDQGHLALYGKDIAEFEVAVRHYDLVCDGYCSLWKEMRREKVFKLEI